MKPSLFAQSGDIRIAIYCWGERPTAEQPRPTVLLVHGYPDAAESWQLLAERLASDCYVIAYDVRGAGRSSKPTGKQAYALHNLLDDMAAVIDAASPTQAVHLVGHDWGSMQGWEAVMSKRLQGRIASYHAMTPAIDHVSLWFRQQLGSTSPRAWGKAARQMFSAIHIALFQLPLLPELSWQLALGRQWPQFLKRAEGITTEARATQTVDACRGLGLYRANILPKALKPEPRQVNIPVQLLIPVEDRFMSADIFDGIENWVPQLSRSRIHAGHWAQLSAPQALAEAIGGFIRQLQTTTAPQASKA